MNVMLRFLAYTSLLGIANGLPNFSLELKVDSEYFSDGQLRLISKSGENNDGFGVVIGQVMSKIFIKDPESAYRRTEILLHRIDFESQSTRSAVIYPERRWQRIRVEVDNRPVVISYRLACTAKFYGHNCDVFCEHSEVSKCNSVGVLEPIEETFDFTVHPTSTDSSMSPSPFSMETTVLTRASTKSAKSAAETTEYNIIEISAKTSNPLNSSTSSEENHSSVLILVLVIVLTLLILSIGINALLVKNCKKDRTIIIEPQNLLAASKNNKTKKISGNIYEEPKKKAEFADCYQTITTPIRSPPSSKLSSPVYAVVDECIETIERPISTPAVYASNLEPIPLPRKSTLV